MLNYVNRYFNAGPDTEGLEEWANATSTGKLIRMPALHRSALS
jgi:hypothetical protein